MTGQSHSANHPLAARMGLLALLAQNIGGGLFAGSYGALLGAVEAKMHVDRELSALGAPLVFLDLALLAPLVGMAATRFPLRAIMMAGAGLAAVGYMVLAVARTMVADLLAYALLVGPGLALLSSVAPSTLITRWFTPHRGRWLGLINMPFLLMAAPIGAVAVLRVGGLETAYLVIAALTFALLLPLWFVRDFPPSAADPSGEDLAVEAERDPGLSIGHLIKRPSLWALSLATASIAGTGTMLFTHFVPLAIGLGLGAPLAASLITVMGGGGIVGSIAFGWLAEKLTGGWALAICCISLTILLCVLLLHPPYVILIVVAALIGLHLTSIATVLAVAMSEQFGAASFSRCFGLGSLIMLPFLVSAPTVAGFMFARTGTYDATLCMHVALLLAGAALAFTVRQGRVAPQSHVATEQGRSAADK